MKDNKHIQSFGEFNENLNNSDVSHSDLKKGIDTLGNTYYYKDSEKVGHIDVAQKDKLGRIVGWMTVKIGTGIFRFNENSELNISDVSDSELFTLELSKEEVMMLRSCLSSLYQNRTPAGDALSFASRLEDKLKDFLK